MHFASFTGGLSHESSAQKIDMLIQAANMRCELPLEQPTAHALLACVVQHNQAVHAPRHLQGRAATDTAPA